MRAEANQTIQYQQRVLGPMPYTLLARIIHLVSTAG
jgi:hypothetical protein